MNHVRHLCHRFARKAEITITLTGNPPKKSDTTKDEKRTGRGATLSWSAAGLG